MDYQYIIAGKEEGFSFVDAKIVCVRVNSPDTVTVEEHIASLRTEGYSQFLIAQHIGHEYTLGDGEILKSMEVPKK